MSSTHLIDAVVRQTTVLLGTLATAAGYRTSVAHVANQVFIDLVKELKQQGVGNKVIADMFGLSLRTYHHRMARMSESTTMPGRSLWEAVLKYLRARGAVSSGAVSRAEVFSHFARDEEAVVRGVLQDLCQSGLVYRAGAGDRTSYRAADPAELDGPAAEPRDLMEHFVLLAISDAGTPTRDDLARAVPSAATELDGLLARLVESGRAREVPAAEGESGVRYRADDYMIPFHEPAGWEAAVLDHYQAMVSAICSKLRRGNTHAAPEEAVGGSTFVFDLWPGHPYQDEVIGLLSELRARLSKLRGEVEAYNAEHAHAGAGALRVIHYLGQNVMGDEGDD